MVDSLHLKTIETVKIDNSFRKSNRFRNFSTKLGFNFRIFYNGHTVIHGSLSEFYNKINEISNTNYPLIPLDCIDIAINAFSDIFEFSPGYLDITRLDLAIDCNLENIYNLKNIVDPTKRFTAGLYDEKKESIYFYAKKENLVILFYQNFDKPGRPPGIRYETRFIKNIPVKILPELNKKKVENIIPFLDHNLSGFNYKVEDFDIFYDHNEKMNYKEIKDLIYTAGLIHIDTMTFNSFIKMLKNLKVDRHIVSRFEKERNNAINAAQKQLITNPLDLLRNQLNFNI
jgi:hypothetical protein